MAPIPELIRRLRARSPLVPRSTRDGLRAEYEQLEHQQQAESIHRYGDLEPFMTFAPPGHFYSPIPPMQEAVDHVVAAAADPPATLPGIDTRTEAQLELAAELAPLHADFDPPENPDPPRRYFTENPAYGIGDARILQALLRHRRPRRIIEIGSGYSSALTLDVVDQHLGGDVEVTFIEPFDELLQSMLRPDDADRVEVVVEPVQQVDLARFDALEDGDVLFIDSTHVVRPGSDVTRDVFEILPRLRPGVAVHFHDIFYPFEYPEAWIREGRAWNEAYLLRAFLAYNEAFEVMLFPHHLAVTARERLREVWPPAAGGVGASLWLRRVR